MWGHFVVYQAWFADFADVTAIEGLKRHCTAFIALTS
jgi:hypothetical protein